MNSGISKKIRADDLARIEGAGSTRLQRAKEIDQVLFL